MIGRFQFLIVIILSSFLVNMAIATNNNYILGIRRSENDKTFDDESITVQQAIIELVNERMNDIYNIIIENQSTYVLENGAIDKKLNELNSTLPLSENTKFQFINVNRPNATFNPSPDSPIEYIPLKSNLVSYVSPVLNYYTIKAYLSDEIVEKVEQLPNVISCKKSAKLGRPERPVIRPSTGKKNN